MKNAVNEFEFAVKAARAAIDDMGVITAQAESRIKAEMTFDKGRASELGRIKNVGGVGGKIAERELEEIARKKYGVSDAEKAGFAEALEEAKEAVAECRALQASISDLYKSEREQLEAMKQSVMKIEVPLMEKWIESARADFDKIA